MADDPLQLPPEASDEDRRQSAILAGALRAHRDRVAPEPTPDAALDARILGEARRRSEQISASRSPAYSGRVPAAGADVGWWLWLGWAAAIAAAVGLWWYLR
jgi:hypothetical protein